MKQFVTMFFVVFLCGNVSAATYTYQEGDGGLYSNTDATYLEGNTTIGSTRGPDIVCGSHEYVICESDGGSGQSRGRTLISFFDIFGSNTGQISYGSTINSAILSIHCSSPFGTADSSNLHSVYQVLTSWSEDSATWNNFNTANPGGIAGTDWVATPVTTFTPSTKNIYYYIDITSLVTAWASQEAANYGVLIINPGKNGSQFRSDDYSVLEYRPMLTVDFDAPPVPEPFSVMLMGTALIALRVKRLSKR